LPGPLIVVDTGVVVRALIGAEGSSSYRLVRAIGTGEFRLALSDEFLRELSEVAGYPKVETRIVSPSRALRLALDIGVMGEMSHPRRLDWPGVRDPRDWWMPDLAWSSEADFIVSWDAPICHFPSKSSRLPRCSGRAICKESG